MVDTRSQHPERDEQQTAEGGERVPAMRRVTVFGGSGFIGRQLVRTLRRDNAAVAVAARHPEAAERAVSRAADSSAGSVTVVRADVTDFDTIVAAVAGADAVINLVGILYEKGAQTFPRVHEQGAANVARAAKKAGVSRLVHMSALGASPTSTSAYARSKAAGEVAVRDAFPEATIIRPSIVFGPEDDFFNRFAGFAKYSPALPLIGGGTTRFQPVYVGDVANAFAAALAAPEHQGKTFELVGPRTYTFKELMELMLATMGSRRFLVPVPFVVAELEGSLLEILPKPPLTRDQVELLKSDNVAGGHEPGLEALGIEPTALEAVLPSYLA